MKTVLAHGVFDLLHLGHVEHLKQARAMGDKLVVSILADDYLPAHKKPAIYGEEERFNLVAALRYVDQAVLCKAPGPQAIIERLRPDIYVRGDDYASKEMPESELLRSLGIAVLYTRSLPIHTKDVIERLSA